ITEQKAEIIPGPEGGAGSSNIANAYEPSRSVETVSGAIGGLQRVTVAVLVNDRPPETLPSDAAAGAEVPLSTPRSDAELEQIASLVRATVGADAARGDQISVVSVPFAPRIDIVPDAPTVWDRVEQVQKPVTTGFALLLATIVGLVALRALRQRPESSPELALAGGGIVPMDSMTADEGIEAPERS